MDQLSEQRSLGELFTELARETTSFEATMSLSDLTE